jgi:regulator of replication initiation timing
MMDIYKPLKTGNEWSIVDQNGGILYDDDAGFETEEQAQFVADFHTKNPDAEWERDVMPAFEAKFGLLDAAQPDAPASEQDIEAFKQSEAGYQAADTVKIQGVFLESFRALHNKGTQLHPAQITYLFSLVDSLITENANLKTVADDLVEERYHLRSKNATLQAELTATRQQLAAAVAESDQLRDQFTEAQGAFEDVYEDCQHVGVIPYHLGDLREALGLSKARPNIATPQATPQPDAPTERPSTITAAEFVEHGYAAKIAAGKCEVWDGSLKVHLIVERGSFRHNDADRDLVIWWSDKLDDKWRYAEPHDTLTVRWLAPAPASEQAAGEEVIVGTVNVYPGVDKQGYDILSGGKLDRWKYDKGDAFEYALVLANDTIRALQAELAATRQQVAAAEIGQLGAAWESFQLEENIDASYQNYKDETQEPLSKSAWLMQVCVGMTKQIHELNSQVFALQATPQPAPEASGLRAAVNWLITIAPVDRPTLPSVDASKSVDAIASEFYAVGWAAATFGAAEKLKTALKAGE